MYQPLFHGYIIMYLQGPPPLTSGPQPGYCPENVVNNLNTSDNEKKNRLNYFAILPDLDLASKNAKFHAKVQ